MPTWGRTAGGRPVAARPSWQNSLMLGGAALAINLAIIFVWRLIPVSSNWLNEMIISALWLSGAALLIIVTNLAGYTIALRGLQSGIESRTMHSLALLLNVLLPGQIMLLVYYVNRSGLLQYFFD